MDNANKAKKAREGTELTYTESDVLHVELRNVPGALGYFAGKLAAKDINITFGAKKAGVILAVSDLKKAAGVR